MTRHYDKFILAALMLAVVVWIVHSRIGAPAQASPQQQTALVAPGDVPSIPANTSMVSTAQGAVSAPAAITKPNFLKTGTAPMPALQVQSALLVDLQSGERYAEITPERQWPMASITKLMTASFAAESIDHSRTVTLTESDIAALDGDESKVLHAGESYTANDLLHAMLVFSSNEAAEALANLYGLDSFISNLNRRAEAWKMDHTFYADPTGLSASNQSTADDLAILAKHVYDEHPELLAITRNPHDHLTELTTGKRIDIQNINAFAGQPDFIGGKTGYTDEANGNLLSIFQYKGRPILVIVLGTDDRFGQTRTLYNWFRSNFDLAS